MDNRRDFLKKIIGASIGFGLGFIPTIAEAQINRPKTLDEEIIEIVSQFREHRTFLSTKGFNIKSEDNCNLALGMTQESTKKGTQEIQQTTNDCLGFLTENDFKNLNPKVVELLLSSTQLNQNGLEGVTEMYQHRLIPFFENKVNQTPFENLPSTSIEYGFRLLKIASLINNWEKVQETDEKIFGKLISSKKLSKVEGKYLLQMSSDVNLMNALNLSRNNPLTTMDEIYKYYFGMYSLLSKELNLNFPDLVSVGGNSAIASIQDSRSEDYITNFTNVINDTINFANILPVDEINRTSKYFIPTLNWLVSASNVSNHGENLRVKNICDFMQARYLISKHIPELGEFGTSEAAARIAYIKRV